jgi:hypothetical protein
VAHLSVGLQSLPVLFRFSKHFSTVSSVRNPNILLKHPPPLFHLQLHTITSSDETTVKQSLHRPGQALRFSGGWSWFQDNQHMKLVRLSALCTGRLYPQEIFLVLASVTGWVDPRNTVRPERICQWNFPVTPSRIEPTIFRLLAQCLNKLRHHVLLKQGDITILSILIFKFLGRHGNRRFTYVFSLLFIFSYMQFWRLECRYEVFQICYTFKVFVFCKLGNNRMQLKLAETRFVYH